MTLEDKLAHFLEISVEANTKASEDELSSYQASLDEQFNAHCQESGRQSAAQIEDELEELRREGNKKQAHEHMIIKRSLSQKQTELTDKLFEELSALVEDYKQTEEYPKLLLRRITEARNFARGEQILIYLDPGDADKKELLEAQSHITLQLSQYAFGGGIRAVIPSRHILIDQSFASKMAEQKENFHFNGGNLHG